MPDETKWYYRWPWTRILMGAYCTACAFVGLIGFSTEPSPSIEAALGYYAVLLYSAILVVSGAIGAIGIFRNIQATVVSVYAIAAATFFHGAAAISQGSPQTGLRLMVAPLMMVPLVWVWGQWLSIVRRVRKLDPPPWPWKR